MKNNNYNNFFLDLHKRCILGNKIPNGGGLCQAIRDMIDKRNYDESVEDGINQIFNLFEPTREELGIEDSERHVWNCFWGYRGKPDIHQNNLCRKEIGKIMEDYSALRQTIVLFCHEILNSR